MPKFPVQHIAQLANIPVTDEEVVALEKAFAETLQVVEKLRAVDVTGVEPTFQVTGLENVLRPDEVNRAKMFTQKQALANAPKQYDGYFVVPQIIQQDEE